ncbi:hypothetical protein, partial [Aeromonas hydrophila]|uniref:hypothetical protein n=1 Tax=Aeromonas hydrophila TaxID=644 RepID=UPI001C0D82C9
AQSNDWAFFRFRHRTHVPELPLFSSRGSVKHAEPDSGHVGVGPFHSVFLAGGNVDVVAMSQLYT